MPELTYILHSHIYTDYHSTRSADSRLQNVVTATATAAPTAMTVAVATAAATANSTYWHGQGSLEPCLDLR